MILENFWELDSSPAAYQIEEINALRDFCTSLSENEAKIVNYPYKLGLAA